MIFKDFLSVAYLTVANLARLGILFQRVNMRTYWMNDVYLSSSNAMEDGDLNWVAGERNRFITVKPSVLLWGGIFRT